MGASSAAAPSTAVARAAARPRAASAPTVVGVPPAWPSAEVAASGSSACACGARATLVGAPSTDAKRCLVAAFATSGCGLASVGPFAAAPSTAALGASRRTVARPRVVRRHVRGAASVSVATATGCACAASTHAPQAHVAAPVAGTGAGVVRSTRAASAWPGSGRLRVASVPASVAVVPVPVGRPHGAAAAERSSTRQPSRSRRARAACFRRTPLPSGLVPPGVGRSWPVVEAGASSGRGSKASCVA